MTNLSLVSGRRHLLYGEEPNQEEVEEAFKLGPIQGLMCVKQHRWSCDRTVVKEFKKRSGDRIFDLFGKAVRFEKEEEVCLILETGCISKENKYHLLVQLIEEGNLQALELLLKKVKIGRAHV